MLEDVKEILRKNKCLMTVSYDSKTEIVSLDIPGRIQEPKAEAFTCNYSIKHNKVVMQVIEGSDASEEIVAECPLYACRILIFISIKRTSESLAFSTNLLDFFVDGANMSEEEFFRAIWPKSIEYTEGIRKQEQTLVELVIRAAKAIVPFHGSFLFEARQMGVGLGYNLVRAFAIGVNNE